MPKTVCSKVYKSPRRPYEKSRMDQEMKLIGQYGLKNKREVWRAKYTLAKIRQAARYLLTLPQTDERRSFEGNSLLRRLVRMGLMSDADMKLDMVLYLKLNDLFERRLQTQVFRLGIAKSVHHARVLIRHRHISVRKQLVNVPSYVVREESRSHIGFTLNSSLAGGRPGRVARRKQKQAEDGDEEGSQE